MRAAGENKLDTERPQLRSQVAAGLTQNDSFNWPDTWRRTAKQRLAAEGLHHVSHDTVQPMLKNDPLQDGKHVCISVASQLARRSPKVSFFFPFIRQIHNIVYV